MHLRKIINRISSAKVNLRETVYKIRLFKIDYTVENKFGLTVTRILTFLLNFVACSTTFKQHILLYSLSLPRLL